MADTEVYVSSSGSNTAPYDTLAKAANLIDTAIDYLETQSGDHTLWLTDEVHTIATNVRFNNAQAGSFHIRSILGYPLFCTVQNADDRMFRLDEDTNAVSFTFEGIRLRKSGTITAGTTAGGLFIQVQGTVTECRLKGCILGPVNLANASASAYPLLRCVVAGGSIVLDDTYCDQISFDNSPEFGVIAHITAGIFRMENGSKLNDITVNHNRNATTNGIVFVDADGIFQTDHSNNQVNDVITDNLDASTGGSAVVMNPPINLETEGAATASSIGYLEFNRVSAVGGVCRGFGVRATGELDFGTLIGRDCLADAEASGTTTGRGLLFVHEIGSTDAGRAAVCTGDRLEIHRCQGDRGAACYSGGGGTTTLGVAAAYGSIAEGGILYSGGDGDFTVNCYLAVGNRYKNDGDDEDGLIFNGIVNNPLTDNTTKSINIRQMTAVGNYDLLEQGLSVVDINGNEPDSFTLTTTIDNIVLDNTGGGLGDELVIDETGASTTHNVTVRNSAIQGGITDNGVSSLTTNEITTSGDFGVDAETGVLSADSPIIAAGRKWWTGAGGVDADGEPFPDWDISIGAIQSKAVPFHPTQL